MRRLSLKTLQMPWTAVIGNSRKKFSSNVEPHRNAQNAWTGPGVDGPFENIPLPAALGWRTCCVITQCSGPVLPLIDLVFEGGAAADSGRKCRASS